MFATSATQAPLTAVSGPVVGAAIWADGLARASVLGEGALVRGGLPGAVAKAAGAPGAEGALN